MRTARWFIALMFLGFLFFIATQARAAGSPEPSVDALLRKAIDATAWTQSMHVRLEFSAKPLGWEAVEARGRFPRGLAGVGEIFADGDRLHTIRQNVPAGGFDGAHVETLLTPGRRIFWIKNYGVDYSESQSVIDGAASADRGLAELGWFLDGQFSDQLLDLFNFSTAVHAGKVQSDAPEDAVGAVSCRVVDIVGDSWELRVWVAPSRGYNFARYKFDSKKDPKTTRKEYHYDVDQIEYEQFAGGKWVIKGGTLHEVYPDAHGNQGGWERVVDRKLIDLSPDFGKLKAFDVPPIPNGESVSIEKADEDGKKIDGSPGILYMWENGKIVPAYHPKLVERIRQLARPDGGKPNQSSTEPMQQP